MTSLLALSLLITTEFTTYSSLLLDSGQAVQDSAVYISIAAISVVIIIVVTVAAERYHSQYQANT